MSSTGGAPRELRIQIPWAAGPAWSPDGKQLIFVGSTNPSDFSEFDWWVAPAEGGQAVKTGAIADFQRAGLRAFSGFIPDVWAGDHIVFSAGLGDSTNLWQIPITPRTWQIKDPPQRLTTGAGQESGPSVAADGSLVFTTAGQRLDLWTLPINLSIGKTSGKPTNSIRRQQPAPGLFIRRQEARLSIRQVRQPRCLAQRHG